jgi:hypothetical protein
VQKQTGWLFSGFKGESEPEKKRNTGRMPVLEKVGKDFGSR